MVSERTWEETFSDLIQEKLPLFRSIAVGIVNSAADADDAVQQAFLRAWERRSGFSGRGDLTAWIARIVVRESYNVLRRRAAAERDRDAALPPSGDGSERQLRRLERAIRDLPELYRDTVNVALLSQADSTEAAKLLGCSTNTLYWRIHKAKTLLKEALNEQLS